MGNFGSWSPKPELGLGNVSESQCILGVLISKMCICKYPDSVFFENNLENIFVDWIPRPYLAELEERLTGDTKSAIKNRATILNKRMAKVTISKDGKKQVSETQCFRQTGYVMYKYPICFLFQLTLINSYLYFFLLSWRRAHPGLEIRKVFHLLLPIHVYLELAYVTSMFVGWLPGWIGELLCCFHWSVAMKAPIFWHWMPSEEWPHLHHVFWLESGSGTCNDFAPQCIQHHPVNLGWRIQAINI